MKSLYTITKKSQAIKNVTRINSEFIGFRTNDIKLDEYGYVLLDVIPCEPLGSKWFIKDLITNGSFLLHPRVPNFGNLENKVLLPVTFDLILYPEPSESRKIEIVAESYFD